MKTVSFPMARYCAFLLILLSFGLSSVSQQTLTKVSKWKKSAYVHLPGDYDQTGSKTYPIIIFFPGIGESTGNPSKLLDYGPSKLVAEGNKMEFRVNGVVEKPIVISVQPDEWPTPDIVDDIITDILSRYRVDINRIYLTGISMGGGSIDNYVTNNSAYAKKIAAIAVMHAVEMPAKLMANIYAENGGKWWGIEGKNDWRGMEGIAYAMNQNNSGSALYTLISSGPGSSHCCWNTFYDPNWKVNDDNLYTWMLKQSKANNNTGFGFGPIIILPVNLISYQASLQDSNVKLSWQTASENNNSHFIIEKSTNGTDFTAIANIKGKGTYNFTTDYIFIDETPAGGINYYRLKQYDFNGNVKDLGTKSVNAIASSKQVSAYPTHITQNTFTLNAGIASNIGQTYQLVDMNGRTVLSGKITQLTKTIEVPALQKGMFILQTSSGKSIKLIKE